MDIEKIKKIDFGEIDGYGDPNLEKYFLDNGYWDKIIDGKVFFVVGKKGTGKSSIYRMIEREACKKGCLVVNNDFGEFPFEKLLQLEDDSFAKPNQYQTIWKNVIYNLFVQAIAKLPAEQNEYYEEIQCYQKMFLGNAVELHKEIVSKAEKKQGSLFLHGLGIGYEKNVQATYKDCADNITKINSTLNNLLVNYFKTTPSESKIIIQFDRLDDNYNQYQNLEEYFQAIISLFKVAYQYNQLLRSNSIKNAKIVLYIRSDILRAIASRDAESARWDDFRFDLNWNVNNIRDIYNSDLYKMVMRRIYVSCPELADKNFNEIFVLNNTTFRNPKLDLFRKLVLQTLFRPRDLIKLLQTLQTEVCKKKVLTEPIYGEVIKKYSNWLVNTEIANEINPILREDYPYVIELLRFCGAKDLSVKRFILCYKAVKHKFSLNPMDLLKYLYSVGIIENTWKNQYSKYMHRSIFRNEGDFDRNLNFRIIPAVWSGLMV